MNFTISLWWGDDSPVYLAIQFVVMQLFCYFYVSTWIKKNITSPLSFFRCLRHAFVHALFRLGHANISDKFNTVKSKYIIIFL